MHSKLLRSKGLLDQKDFVYQGNQLLFYNLLRLNLYLFVSDQFENLYFFLIGKPLFQLILIFPNPCHLRALK